MEQSNIGPQTSCVRLGLPVLHRYARYVLAVNPSCHSACQDTEDVSQCSQMVETVGSNDRAQRTNPHSGMRGRRHSLHLDLDANVYASNLLDLIQSAVPWQTTCGLVLPPSSAI